MNDPRGSNWRKWDLHVHTPASIVQHYGSHTSDETWENFINDLEGLPPEFKVIGINDYIFLDGYRKVLEFKNGGRLKNIDLILPVIELRIDKFAGSEKLRNVNFHVIFSDKLKADDIQVHFLNGLFNSYVLGPSTQWSGLPTMLSLEEFGQKIIDSAPEHEAKKAGSPLKLGFDNLDFQYDRVLELLRGSYFQDSFLTGIGKAEWAQMSYGSSIAAKRDTIESVDFIFTAAHSVEAYRKGREALEKQKLNATLLDCSDAHYLSTTGLQQNCIGQCFTWIKADPTFLGLRHALIEFEERVYVGKTPDKLISVANNPTRYIQSIRFSKKSNAKTTEKWFAETEFVPLNSGLVSIVGNQGSGKSALTDTLGLLGNTKNNAYFSFLKEDSFTNKKDKLASGFEAEILWNSGDTNARPLDYLVGEDDVELVRYIPQQFFENICNDIKKKDNPFEIQFHNVIYSHIPTAERHDCNSLLELRELVTGELHKVIAILQSDISELNRNIVGLEEKLSSTYRTKLENLRDQKKRDLDAHDALKPSEVAPPADGSDEGTSRKVNEKKAELSKLNSRDADLDQQIKDQSDTLAKCMRANDLILALRMNLTAFESDYFELHLPINCEEIFTYSIRTEKLDQMIDSVNEQKLKFTAEKEGIPEKRTQLTKELEELTELLNQPGKLYEAYKQALATWQVERGAIIGDSSVPGTIGWYESELKAIDDIPNQISVLKADRKKTSIEIHKKLLELADRLRGLYAAVQKFIDQDDLAKTLKIELDVSIEERGFANGFLELVQQNKGSFFRGGDGKVKELTQSQNFNFIEDVDEYLESADVWLSSLGDLHEVAKGGAAAIYDYVFALEFLEPAYQLKLFGKRIEQLSPGQRGSLLLVFYLLVDIDDRPLIVDQPEGNLDGEYVYDTLVAAIKRAKKNRQIIIATHNSNLAMCCDSEQIIHATIDRTNGNAVNYSFGAMERPELKKVVMDKLEGTIPAFSNRRDKFEFGLVEV